MLLMTQETTKVDVVPASAVNVVDFGAVPNDSQDDTAAITKALNACADGDAKVLLFPGGTFNLSALAFPRKVNVVVQNGARLAIKKESAITFNGPFTAGLYPVFTGEGAARFGDAAVAEVYPQWWMSPGEDDSLAIQKAVDSSPALAGLKIKLVGRFNCRTTVHIGRNRVHLAGNGKHASTLAFNPASALPLLEFKDNSTQCSVRDLALVGAGPNKKVGIKAMNISFLEIRGIAILNWHGNQSIGLEFHGREFGFMDDLCIGADLPIFIGKNSKYPSLCCDHFVFQNMCLQVGDPNGPAIKVESGSQLSNVVFQGANSWNLGKYGFYWEDADSDSKGSSINLSIRNVRMEQGTASGGEMIHIGNGYVLQNLRLENIMGCSGGVGGIYLRKCFNATLENIFFVSVNKPTPTALDIDESCGNVVLINNWWHSGNIKTGKLVRTMAGHSSPDRDGNRVIEAYDQPNNPQGEGLLVYGTRTWCYSGTLAPNASLSLPIGGTTSKVATILIAATGGREYRTPEYRESGYFMAAGGTVALVTGTSEVSAKDTAEKLCLISGASITLKNRLIAPVDVVITVFWSDKRDSNG